MSSWLKYAQSTVCCLEYLISPLLKALTVKSKI